MLVGPCRVRADGRRVTLAVDLNDAVPEIERHAVRDGDGPHAGCPREVLTNRPEQGRHVLLGVPIQRKINRREEQAFRLESDLSRGGCADLMELHAADHEERHRDARLNRSRQAMDAPDAASAAAAGVVFERRDESGTAEPDGRHQSEHQARDEAESDTRRVRPDIRNEQVEIRMPPVEPPRQQRGHAEEHGDRERATDQREDDRLRQEVLHQTAAAGSDGLAQCELALADGAAHRHHARDVQADNEEDDA